MSFGFVGAIFVVMGILFLWNIKGAADKAFELFSNFTPRVGSATPKTLRVVGGFWIPFGAAFILFGISR